MFQGFLARIAGVLRKGVGWGGGGEWSLTRVSINFDPFEKISHSWVCHETPSQRALMVAYM